MQPWLTFILARLVVAAFAEESCQMAYTKAGLITTKEKCKIPEANDISLESLHNAGVKASLAPRLCKKLTKSLMPLLLLLVALLFPTFLLPTTTFHPPSGQS